MSFLYHFALFVLLFSLFNSVARFTLHAALRLQLNFPSRINKLCLIGDIQFLFLISEFVTQRIQTTDSVLKWNFKIEMKQFPKRNT